MPRRLVTARAGLVVLGVLLTSLSSVSNPAAAATGVTVASSVAATGTDFATSTWSDPWDYSNAADALLDNTGPAAHFSGQSIANGTLSFSMSSAGYFSPLWGGYPGSLYLGRDGALPSNSIDASRYTKTSMRAYASTKTNVGLMWFNCAGLNSACEGGMPFTLQAGWHTYDLVMANRYSLPVPWSGRMTGLRFALSPASPTNFKIDYLRLYSPGTSTQVHFPVGSKLHWQDSATSGEMPCGSGYLPCTSGTADTSSLPAGTYRFWVEGASTSPSPPLTLHATPVPIVTDPDASGGADYGAAIGNPWDMATASDVNHVSNASNIIFSGGTFNATNSGPTQNDPHFGFHLGATGIDTTKYHRFTITMSYDGPFNLSGAPGGGTMGRLIWTRADKGSALMQTKDWVTYSGVRTYTYDLNAPTAALNEESAGNKYPFVSASRVTSLRWDPNEDPGRRRWHILDAKLQQDDRAGSSFAIHWNDAAATATSRVALYYDTDRAGYNGKLIASGIGESTSGNSHTWNTAALPNGTYWVYCVITDGPSSGRTYAGGLLRVAH